MTSVECQNGKMLMTTWGEENVHSGRKSRMKKTIDNFYGSKMIRHIFNEGIPVSMINKKGSSTFW